jgi:hypothetical protein
MAALTSMDEPNSHDLSDFQRFLQSPEMGPSKLDGWDALIYGSVDMPHNRADDLVCMIKPEKEDSFSRWFLEKLMAAFFACRCHRYRKPDKVTGDIFYLRRKILRITYYITTALAPLLLILAITVLWLVPAMKARLIIVAVFTTAVSLCLAVFTTAPRSQVFAITAAYVFYFERSALLIICKFCSCASCLCRFEWACEWLYGVCSYECDSISKALMVVMRPNTGRYAMH